MRVLLTGATGSLGGEVARLLVERGDEVRAPVRDPRRARALHELGVEVVQGDLVDEAVLVQQCRGVQAVVHAAALAEIGVTEERREAMVDANVVATERVLGAALSAGVMKAVHVSSVTVFGDTGGRVVDEGWQRDPSAGWTSAFEQTKALAHRRAREIASRGLPLVVVQPGAVYGPDPEGALGDVVCRFLDGALPALVFPDVGVCPVHRDDVAAGVLLALDKGVPGESYVLAGEPLRLGDVFDVLADVSGRRPPRLSVPSSVLRALAPAGPLVGRALGLPPNLREVVTSCDRVTFWASSDKAMDELGWTHRTLREGVEELVAAR